MNETFRHSPVPEEGVERRENYAQLLPTNLSADYRNEFVALWAAAGRGDSDMLRDILKVTPGGHIRTYAQRFADDTVIREALDKADPDRVARLDTLVEQLNTLLLHAAAAELPAIAALCLELDSTLTGKSDPAAEAREAAAV